MSKALVPLVDEQGELVIKPTIVQVQAEQVTSHYRIISFKNRPMIEVDEGYPHFIPLTKERFDKMFYNIMPGQTRSRVSDVFAQVCNTAPDLTANENLILFGRVDVPDGMEKPPNHPDSVVTVWDMHDLSTSQIGSSECVWRSPYAKIGGMKAGSDKSEKIEFIMQLAGGDEGLYDDIMQSIAPMIMDKKPDGAIWWVGAGANGKSTLMDALYRLFPGQLASLTVKSLTDGRDTPNLNGNLANIVKESSEGRIDDTEIYKSIGTHEDFTTHKFHSQETITIRGNMHHIFSANLIPAFNDKGYSARRRTFVIPFNEKFVSDPNFEEKTFTPEFFGRLAQEMSVYAHRIERQGYRYKWSAKTLGAKANYDTEANNAEEYAGELIQLGVVGFDSFLPVRTDYENYCAEHGYVPLGVGAMRRALQATGFDRKSISGGEKGYRLPNFKEAELQQLNILRPGLYTVAGFQPENPVVIPEFDEVEAQEETDTIGSDW